MNNYADLPRLCQHAGGAWWPHRGVNDEVQLPDTRSFESSEMLCCMVEKARPRRLLVPLSQVSEGQEKKDQVRSVTAGETAP